MICETHGGKSENILNSGLSICFTGSQKCTPGHRFGPAVRDHYIIHYVLRGKGTFEQNGACYTLQASDGFLITPYHTATYCADAEEPWEYVWFAFRGEHAESILNSCGLSVETPIFHYRLEEALEKSIPIEYHRTSNVGYRDLEAMSALYKFLALLARNFREQDGEKEYRGQALRQAMAFIEANYFNDLTVEDIATYVGLSRSQLYRIFQNTLGQSVQNYILKYRLDKASYLLRRTDLGVAEIALSCGFPDQSYFTRCFKACYGKPPLAYRSSDGARPVRK